MATGCWGERGQAPRHRSNPHQQSTIINRIREICGPDVPIQDHQFSTKPILEPDSKARANVDGLPRARRNGIPAVRPRIPLTPRSTPAATLRGKDAAAPWAPPCATRTTKREARLEGGDSCPPRQWLDHATAIDTARKLPGNDRRMILPLPCGRDARAPLPHARSTPGLQPPAPSPARRRLAMADLISIRSISCPASSGSSKFRP